MAYNMAWFRKQAELKKAEEEKAKAEAAAEEIKSEDKTISSENSEGETGNPV